MSPGGKISADFENFALISGEGPVVSLLVNLVQGVIGILVPLELQDIDVFVCLDERVNAAVGGVPLHFDLLAHQLEHHIHRVLEIELVVAHDLVVHVGEECAEPSHQHLDGSATDVLDEFINREAGLALYDRSKILAQGIQETILDLFVGIYQRISINAAVVVLNGQIAGLVEEGNDIGADGIDPRKVE